jgi:iron complex transport system permease protein
MGVLLLMVMLAVSWGSADITIPDVWRVIWAHIWPLAVDSGDPATHAIIWEIRMPRVVLAGLVGAALAGAGVVFQGLLRNPLADPYVLGVSSGAALGAAVAILTGWGITWFGVWNTSIWAFLAGLFALLLVIWLSKTAAAHSLSGSGILILSGVVVQALFGAMLTYILSISEEQLQRIQFWLMGSLSMREWSHSVVLFPFLITGLGVLWCLSPRLNLLTLGEREAYHLGMPVERTRTVLLLTATLMTGTAVAVSGIIGFVGLVIPHIQRLLSGPDHRVLLPVSALSGAAFLIGADLLARVAMEPREIPIGVVTAFIGAPFFAWLLRSKSNQLC